MNTFTKLATIAAIAGFATSAEASTTIDFTGAAGNHETYSEDGFTISTDSTWSTTLTVYGSGSRYRGSEAIGPRSTSFMTSLMKDGGGLFDVVSFDIANAVDTDTYTEPSPVDVLFTATYGDDSTDTFRYTNLSQTGFTTVNFNGLFDDIKSLSWQAQQATQNFPGQPYFSGDRFFVQYDNIQITEDTVVTPPITPGVPEPSTWLMMLAGFAVTGFSLKRRNTLAANAA